MYAVRKHTGNIVILFSKLWAKSVVPSLYYQMSNSRIESPIERVDENFPKDPDLIAD